MTPTKPRKPAMMFSDTLEIMNEFPNMKEFHIIMDRTCWSSHHWTRLYICLCTFPEITPIEMFWKVLKDGVRKTQVLEILDSRIMEGEWRFSLLNICKAFIDCLNKVPLTRSWSILVIKKKKISGRPFNFKSFLVASFS